MSRIEPTERAFLRLNGLARAPDAVKGGVAAIGNFDGVHRGHQFVLEEVRNRARLRGVPALILTFEPHPRDVLAPTSQMFRLTEGEAKSRIAEAIGFDAIAVMQFSLAFAQIEPEAFITHSCSVCDVQPILAAIEETAAQREECSPS